MLLCNYGRHFSCIAIIWQNKGENVLYQKLEDINIRPHPFQYYTAEELWTDEHTSKKMLKYHLDENINASSRNKKFIEHFKNPISTLKSFLSILIIFLQSLILNFRK